VTDDVDSWSELATAVEGVLAFMGPMDVEALADALAGRGFYFGADAVDHLLEEVLEVDNSVYLPLPDARWCHLPSLLSGRTSLIESPTSSWRTTCSGSLPTSNPSSC
jgi:hypothetical protein